MLVPVSIALKTSVVKAAGCIDSSKIDTKKIDASHKILLEIMVNSPPNRACYRQGGSRNGAYNG